MKLSISRSLPGGVIGKLLPRPRIFRIPSTTMFNLTNLIKSGRIACLLVVLFSSVAATSAYAGPLPAPPQLSADSYMLVDYDSGQVLAEKDADKQVEPASLTKMMTAYVVSQEVERGTVAWDDEVIISEKAQAMEGSRMFIEAGKDVRLWDLLKGLIIQSGNDSSVAVAEHIAGSEDGFVSLMNQTAEELGMTSTNYVNASGLPHPEHYTTANDLAVLSRALIRDYPQEYILYAVRQLSLIHI